MAMPLDILTTQPTCRFAVGHDAQGRWIVCDAEGRSGGLFKDQFSAFKYALEASSGRRDQVLCIPDSKCLPSDAAFAPLRKITLMRVV